MATETADSADSILLATSATNVLLSTVTPGLTGLMSKQLSDSVIIQILRKLELPDVLALRATSRRFADLASRLFRQLFPARRICLNERLLREPGRWEIGGPEHRTLDGLRKLYAAGGPVTVDIVVLTIVEGALAVLVVERAEDPYKGDVALPGGFVRPDESLDAAFLKGAEARHMLQLKGHRSVGGMRASIYNAMPVEGVKALVAYMKEFEAKHG
jgi:hypothetical protein